ncbi:MAG: 2-phospho-L-lactate guanylyltransferase [Hyphomicrobiales bacterium]|nr:2-phospho-L-lactate guanylyltransferase [Hyphomicrobiales bacterium]
MNDQHSIWVLIPVKETAGAKARLGHAVPSHLRQGLALAMLEDVLNAVSGVHAIAGLVVVTVDSAATALARRYGARIITDGAARGHSGAVNTAAGILQREGKRGFLQMPLDIPLVSSQEIATIVAMYREEPCFVIAPSNDELGSNGILVSPPTAVPLTFGDNSFFPHLRAAQACGVSPQVVRLHGFGLDIDRPDDLYAFAKLRSNTCTQAYLDRHRLAGNVDSS